jgi:hypothetical protein
MSCNEIIPGIWQGSAPEPGPLVGRRFAVLVLCAEEYQPEAGRFPGCKRVLRAELDDAEPTPRELAEALRAAQHVVKYYRRGWPTLVTCAQGLNRSGLVSGLAMRRLGVPGPATVQLIRRARGEFALSNSAFRRIVEGTHLGRLAEQPWA